MRFFLAIFLAFCLIIPVQAEAPTTTSTTTPPVSSLTAVPTASTPTNPSMAETAKSALLMEQSSGQVLFERAADIRLPIASVTKTMTMLLAMEALDSGVVALDTMLTCSAYAATMGGSQVYLEPGEQMSFNDAMKAIAVASGNDASVMMAEHLAGSEAEFVGRMNARAIELGMNNTHFINCNGLDEGTEAYSSARDVALMSRELLRHPKIHDYLTIWMDSLRGGEFQLSNTNRLVRFYDGANGIKTGSTSDALYCLSASAKRNDMTLIAVVLGAPSTDERFDGAESLLNHGFANYAIYNTETLNAELGTIAVDKGKVSAITVKSADGSGVVVPKSKQNAIKREVTLPEKVAAPIANGDVIGSVSYVLDGTIIANENLVAEVSSGRLNFWDFCLKLLRVYSCAK